MAWTTPEVSEYVKHMLGYPNRVVELDDDNITEALKRAIRKYAAIMPVLKKGRLSVSDGTQAYNLDTLGLPYGKGLTNVYVEPISSDSIAFNEFDVHRLRVPPHVDLGSLIAEQLYWKEIGYITGTDFDWEWDQASATLLLTPSPTRSLIITYDYNSTPLQIGEVPAGHQGWVADFTLALCKEMLGRVRNKFKGVPGNDLEVTTDGDDLLSEAKEMQESLVESLNGQRGDWTPPIKG